MNRAHIEKVLREIQGRVPKLWRDNVVTIEKATPTIEFVMQEVLDKELLTPEKREQIRVLMESGDFSKTKPVENPKYAKLIDRFITREINKEIKKGNLPKKYKSEL